MGDVVPFRMHTIDEVLSSLPSEIKPSKKDFNELVEKHGLYRNLCGKKFMLDSDIETLFEVIRQRPKEADMRGGPARLISGEHSPNAVGYLVVLGDKLDKEAPVFVGWAPRDATGITDLKRLIQYGYPGQIGTIDVSAGTPKEVADVRAKLGTKAAIGSDGWYVRSDEVIGLLVALRNQGINQLDDDEDETEIETKMGA